MRTRLAEVQQLLYRLITSPNGVEEGLEAENQLPRGGIGALIIGDHRLNASKRIGIYADMYFFRLLDAIREDFPATAEILGSAQFHNLITAFLVAYPPSQPSITDASRHLAEFVKQSQWSDQFPFLSDLIRVERAVVEVFLGADAAPVSFDELRAIPLTEWASLQFSGHPASQLLDCDWRVDQVLSAVERRSSVRPPAREPRSIVVWRKASEVRYRAVEDPERTALRLIHGRVEFEQACEAIARLCGDAEAPETMIELLRQWVADGLLIRG